VQESRESIGVSREIADEGSGTHDRVAVSTKLVSLYCFYMCVRLSTTVENT
jgi:hypothetical protein